MSFNCERYIRYEEHLHLQNNLTTSDSFNTKIYYLQKYMYNIIYLNKNRILFSKYEIDILEFRFSSIIVFYFTHNSLNKNTDLNLHGQ